MGIVPPVRKLLGSRDAGHSFVDKIALRITEGMRWARGTGTWSLRLRLGMVVAALAVPLSVLFIASLVFLADANRSAQKATLLYTARSLIAAVDAQLGRGLAVAKLLAGSPELLMNDLTLFEAEARRVSLDLDGAWVLVSSPDGQLLVNTAAPPGARLPRRSALGIAAQDRAIASHAPVVSDVLKGLFLNRWVATIDIAIFKDGQPFRILSVAMDLQSFHGLLNGQIMPKGWLAGVIDRQGKFVARVPRNEENIGQPASEGWRAIKDGEGIFEFESLEGERVTHGNAVSRWSGWSVGVAAKNNEIEAAAWQTLALAAVLGIAVCAAGLVLAVMLARRITSAVHDFRRNAMTLIQGQEVKFNPRIPEIAELWSALEMAVSHRAQSESERKHQEMQIRLLMREVNHRSKNVLAVVQSIARNTAKSSPDDFVDRFSERVLSLAASHDLLVNNNWQWTDLDELVKTQLAHLQDLMGRRIVMRGVPVQLSSSAAQIIGMTLHELATNASKYGALSNDEGTVTISWSWTGTEGVPEKFCMNWIERGGPPLVPPTRRGFGSTVIDRLAGSALAGTITVSFDPAGFEWHLECPAENLRSRE